MEILTRGKKVINNIFKSVQESLKSKPIGLYLGISIPLIFFCLYYTFRSISLDDWDSILFASTVKDYDVVNFRPHSPGYVIYIFVAKFFHLFYRNPQKSLILVSVISGSLGIFVFYKILGLFSLGKKENMRNWIFAIMLGVFPLYFINSLKAMTDIFALLGYLIWLFFFLKDFKKRKFSYGIWISAALLLGIRLHFIMLLLIPMAIYVMRVAKESFKKALLGILLFALITAVWTGLTVIASKATVGEVIESYKDQYMYRYKVDEHTPFEEGVTIISHLRNHIYFMVHGGFGINIDAIGSKAIVDILVFVFGGGILLLAQRAFNTVARKDRLKLFLFSLLPYIIFCYLNLTYTNARYYLPLIPFLIICVKILTDNANNMRIKNTALFLILLVEVSIAIPLGLKLHTVKSPPHQFADYLNRNYPNNQILVLSGFKWEEKHVDYYTRADNIKFVGEADEKFLQELNMHYPKGEIFIQVGEGEEPPEIENIEIQRCGFFTRDKRAHYKHNYIGFCLINLI